MGSQCAAGSQICASDGSAWGACLDQVLPAVEDCNALGDEDCDGVPCSDTIWSDDYSGYGVRIHGTAVSAGAIFIGGTFMGTLHIGSDTLQSTQSGPSSDGFVAKLDAAGNPLWARSFGGLGNEGGFVVASDGVGGVIVTGSFSDTINFGTTSLTELVAEGSVAIPSWSKDAFLARLDASGDHVWSRVLTSHANAPIIGPVGRKLPAAVAVSGGDIFVAGSFTGHWGGFCFLTNCPSEVDGNAAFLARYAVADGTSMWRQSFDAAGSESASALAVGSQIYLGGTFNDGLQLGALTEQSTTTVGWLAAVSFDGVPQWLHGLSGGGGAVEAIAATATGAVVAGKFSGSMNLGGLHNAVAGADGFTASVSANGAIDWVQSYDELYVHAVASDSAGDLVVAGALFGSVDLGGGLLSAVGTQDVLLAKLDPSGAHRWSHRYGGDASTSAMANRLLLLPDDTIVMSGMYLGALDLGAGALPPGNPGGVIHEAFLARVHP